MTDKERIMEILTQPIHPRLDADPIEALADYLIDNGVTVRPAVPGREMGYDMAELCYRNGEEAMREKVINYLRDQKGVTMGAIRSTLSDAIEKVRKL